MTTYRITRGFTLIELMIAVAIIALLAGIAIPAYNRYVMESQFSTARMNAEPLRLALEDYFLDNETYADINGHKWIPGGANTLETADPGLSWRPDGDNNDYDYEVTADATNYSITVTHRGSSRSVTCTKIPAAGDKPCKYSS